MSVLKSIVRAAIRIIVALLFIAVPLAVFKLALMPALGLDRDLPPTEAIASDPTSFYVNVVTTLLISISGYWLYVRAIERRRAPELALRSGEMLLGLASGMFLIGLPIVTLYLSGHYELMSYAGFGAPTLAIALIVTIAVLLEEIIFRGVVFSVLERHFGTISALLVESLIFSAVHLANDNWHGFLPVLSGFLIGCLWTCLYVVFRNIWMVALHHAAWNLTIFSTGLPLSGIEEWRRAAPLQSEFHGSTLLTGGVSGPEISVVTLAVVVSALAALSYWAYKKCLILRPTAKTAPGYAP